MKHTMMIALVAALAAVMPAQAQDSEQRKAASLDELLEMVRTRSLQDRSELQKREREFDAARDRQAELLRQAKKKRDELEKESQRLEDVFEKNKETIAVKQQLLRDKLGSLKELFGIFQQTAGDLIGIFQSSPTSAQYPNRTEFLQAFAKKMGRSSQITTIEEIEQMWFEMQREMTETGKIVRFDTPVLRAEGNEETKPVVRVGVFNVVLADGSGNYANWNEDTQKLAELKRQPAGRFTSSAADFAESRDDYAGFALDPTGGSLLARLVQSPDIMERVKQGGTVGYIIIAVGAVTILIAIWRILVLILVGGKVRAQLGNTDKPSDSNPLGRVLMAYHENKGVDSETLEMKLGKAILRELPAINGWLMFIKVVAVMAPLLGLLGTVTGMIETFQAITLFGTGDPKTMAGGISQALVTTVLGLCVAIPTVFLHTLASGRAKAIGHTLTEQSAGLVAEYMESRRAGGQAQPA